jgi:hypothetical protein
MVMAEIIVIIPANPAFNANPGLLIIKDPLAPAEKKHKPTMTVPTSREDTQKPLSVFVL